MAYHPYAEPKTDEKISLTICVTGTISCGGRRMIMDKMIESFIHNASAARCRHDMFSCFICWYSIKSFYTRYNSLLIRCWWENTMCFAKIQIASRYAALNVILIFFWLIWKYGLISKVANIFCTSPNRICYIYTASMVLHWYSFNWCTIRVILIGNFIASIGIVHTWNHW